MKKNKMMRLASFLLIAVLVSTSAISGTYAKYVTTGSAEDTARVAKWGVKVVADGSNTFWGYYKALADGNVMNITYDANTDTVKSEGGKVVAPGTTGTVAGLTINGTPEVDTKITFAAEVTLTGWEVPDGDDADTDPDYYCPLVFMLKYKIADGTTQDVTISGKDFASADLFAAEIAEQVAFATDSFEAGTPINDNSLQIEWEWPFVGDDVKDTALGDAATAAQITVKVTATVTQVD